MLQTGRTSRPRQETDLWLPLIFLCLCFHCKYLCRSLNEVPFLMEMWRDEPDLKIRLLIIIMIMTNVCSLYERMGIGLSLGVFSPNGSTASFDVHLTSCHHFISLFFSLSSCPVSCPPLFFLSFISVYIFSRFLLCQPVQIFSTQICFSLDLTEQDSPKERKKNKLWLLRFLFLFLLQLWREMKKKQSKTEESRTEHEDGVFGIRNGMNWIRSSTFTESQLTEIVLIAN